MTRPLRNDDENYGSIAITLHWLVAVAVLAMLATAIYAGLAPDQPTFGQRLRLHSSIGVIFYLAIAARIIWHWAERRPRPLSANPALRRAARGVHLALLVLISCQLVTGPLDVWSGGWPLGVFDWFAIPSPIGAGKKPWHDAIGTFHLYSGYCIALLVSLHIAAAAKHHLIDRDRTVLRMLGLRSSGRRSTTEIG